MIKFPVFVFFIIFLWGCNGPDKSIIHNPNALTYTCEGATNGTLPLTVALSGDMAIATLTARIKLENTGAKQINIQEIVVSTTKGIRSAPDSENMSFSVKPGKDTVLSLKFHPINDGELYRIAGMRGGLQPVYSLSVTYKTEDNNDVVTLPVTAKADPGEYTAYSRKFRKAITGYSFNTKAGFNEREKHYLQTLQLGGQQPFVYLSNQEIAVSGLNFRLQSYQLNDTLHAQLYIINHSEFPVKIVPADFDITDDKAGVPGAKFVRLEKISGSRQDLSMMEKGDRVLIHFKKPMKTQDSGKEHLSLHLQKTFMLTGRKNLFNEDVQLVQVTL